MKKVVLFFSLIFLFFISFLTSDFVIGEAKVSSNGGFEVVVGRDDILPVYYGLGRDENNEIRDVVHFYVEVKGNEDNSNTYKWTHTFCYKLNDEEVCEIDAYDYFKGNSEFVDYFYDSDMPYYSDDLEFEYVTFKNKFECLDCDGDSVIEMAPITFSASEIDYKYYYGVEDSLYGQNTHIGLKTELLFNNNMGSKFDLVREIETSKPKYNIINEICVGGKCSSEEYNSVTSNGGNYYMSPYVGNIYFSYELGNEVKNGDMVYVKTVLKCVENCEDTRRIGNVEKQLYEHTYIFNGSKPSIDLEKSTATRNNTITKSASFTIFVIEDLEWGYDEGLKYYLMEDTSRGCNSAKQEEYSFASGEAFVIGANMNGSYCVYYEITNKLGAKYTSSIYRYVFDNEGPVIYVNEHDYDSNKHYNEINNITLSGDDYSGISEAYYYFSVNSSEDYLTIKNNGTFYAGPISLEKEGSYYLHVLAYDRLKNYSVINGGLYNLDVTPLVKDDLSVEIINQKESYSSDLKVKVSIDEKDDDYTFKCGFIKGQVGIESLVNTCKNNEYILVPTGYEGEYSFYAYVSDRANNNSLVEVASGLKVDTVAPVVNYTALYNDDEYHLTNEITLDLSDVSGVNYGYLKYGWFAKNSTVNKEDVSNSFNINEAIKYPVGYYGEYKLYVVAMDNLGNEKLTSLNKVFKIDTDVINISLNGEQTIHILKGQDYVELGASAYKGVMGVNVRTSEVVVSGEVNVHKAGTYYLTYSSGEGDVLVSVTRKIVVEDDSLYVIAGTGLFTIGLLVVCLRLFIRRKNSESM